MTVEIEGTIRANLLAAIASARRWKGREVHEDTLRHWDEIVQHARASGSDSGPDSIGELVAELETELASRKG